MKRWLLTGVVAGIGALACASPTYAQTAAQANENYRIRVESETQHYQHLLERLKESLETDIFNADGDAALIAEARQEYERSVARAKLRLEHAKNEARRRREDEQVPISRANAVRAENYRLQRQGYAHNQAWWRQQQADGWNRRQADWNRQQWQANYWYNDAMWARQRGAWRQFGYRVR